MVATFSVVEFDESHGGEVLSRLCPFEMAGAE